MQNQQNIKKEIINKAISFVAEKTNCSRNVATAKSCLYVDDSKPCLCRIIAEGVLKLRSNE